MNYKTLVVLLCLFIQTSNVINQVYDVHCAAALFINPCPEPTSKGDQVCGYYSSEARQCLVPPCADTFGNGCLACGTQGIEGYNNGPCPSIGEPEPRPTPLPEPIPLPEPNPQPEYDVSCSTVKFATPCPETNNEQVCGFFNPDIIQCIHYPCASTYDNGCKACNSGEVIGYNLGACPVIVIDPPFPVPEPEPECEQKNYICKDSDRNKKCKQRSDRDFVCAQKFLRCPEGVCDSYYRNRCEACADPQVYSVHSGLCRRDEWWIDNFPVYKCQKKDRGLKICPLYYQGVCAVTERGLREESNVCTACSDESVFAVYLTRCKPFIIAEEPELPPSPPEFLAPDRP